VSMMKRRVSRPAFCLQVGLVGSRARFCCATGSVRLQRFGSPARPCWQANRVCAATCTNPDISQQVAHRRQVNICPHPFQLFARIAGA